jgi:type 1 glutamine amidotransferase
MHSYRVTKEFGKPLAPGAPGALWFDYLGLQSSGHGPQEPIAITFTATDSPITRGMENWTTIKEELYNNVQDPKNFPGHQSLASGKQTVKAKDGTLSDKTAVVVWTNTYGPKQARVFSTTLGHNNLTVNDPRFLDLVTRGVLWATGQLDPNGHPAPGCPRQRLWYALGAHAALRPRRPRRHPLHPRLHAQRQMRALPRLHPHGP